MATSTDLLSTSWVSRAAFVSGLSQYIIPRDPKQPPLELTADRWTLEVYRTVIGTLQSIAWMLLGVFVFLLIAYVVARGLEARGARAADRNSPTSA
jgi:hypothetical protein